MAPVAAAAVSTVFPAQRRLCS